MTDHWNPFGQPEDPNQASASGHHPSGLPFRPTPEAEGGQTLRQFVGEPPLDRRPPRSRRIVSAAVIGVAVIAVAGVGWAFGKPLIEELRGSGTSAVTDFAGPGVGEVSITVSPGDLGSDIATKLVAAGVIASTGPFIDAFTAAGKQAEGIQPGTYLLRAEMSAQAALEVLMDPAARQVIQFTVPEGKRAEEVYQIIGAALAKADLGDDADPAVLEATATADAETVRAAAQDTAAIGLPPEANGIVEGWLFPNTYSFNLGTGAKEILAQMVTTAVNTLEELGVPRDRWLEIMTVASLVEKESNRAEDRGKVARVFYNRIEIGMRLESDVTARYGAGQFDSSVMTTDEALQDPNPYNTYIHTGLPPSAIANPGEAAILAALEPTEGAWIYFTVVDPNTGETEFNETYEGHLRSVEKLYAWLAEHPQ
ncbi:MAG: endolytic transglycosylase MltG [Bifidobacteriaceae bacterium]|nr:endolytic transglycosylase MltG [Bifidobacteriaceae bacterium]